MKKNTLPILIVIGMLASCKSVKEVAIPAPLKDNADKYHVVGTGLSILGHKFNIEGYGEAKMYSGFSIGTSDIKRWIPAYFDLDKSMKHVSKHFQQILDVSKTKYRFDMVSNDIYVNTYCVARSAEGSVNVKDLNIEMGLGESYRFEGLIFTNKDTMPWKLTIDGSKTQKYGAGDYLKNVRNTNGVLTNDKDIINVNVVNISDTRTKSKKQQTPSKIAVGYEFRLNDNTLAFVNLRDRDIWVSKNLDPHTRAVIVSAATSILIKINTA